MSTSNIEKARQYINANGGHSTVASTINVTPAASAEICLGRRPPTPQFAAGMAPLLGVTAAQIMREDSDLQLLTRRGVL